MTAPKARFNPTTAALLGLLIAIVGYQSFANRPAAQGPTGPVATFDLERTFNSLHQKKAAFDRIPAISEELQADSDQKRKELEQMKADLDILVKGTPKHNELQDKIIMATRMYQAHIEFGRLKLEAEKGRILKNVYVDIRSAVREIAQANGYAVVFVDDSVGEIPPGTLEDLNRQISARRIAYTSADITDQIIDHMNRAFKAAGGVASQTP